MDLICLHNAQVLSLQPCKKVEQMLFVSISISLTSRKGAAIYANVDFNCINYSNSIFNGQLHRGLTPQLGSSMPLLCAKSSAYPLIT